MTISNVARARGMTEIAAQKTGAWKVEPGTLPRASDTPANQRRKYHNWHYFTIPKAPFVQNHTKHTRANTPPHAETERRHPFSQGTPDKRPTSRPTRTRAQTRPNRRRGQSACVRPNRCQTKRYPENSSFQTRRRPFFVVNIMPIMVLSPSVSGRCLGGLCRWLVDA